MPTTTTTPRTRAITLRLEPDWLDETRGYWRCWRPHHVERIVPGSPWGAGKTVTLTEGGRRGRYNPIYRALRPHLAEHVSCVAHEDRLELTHAVTHPPRPLPRGVRRTIEVPLPDAIRAPLRAFFEGRRWSDIAAPSTITVAVPATHLRPPEEVAADGRTHHLPPSIEAVIRAPRGRLPEVGGLVAVEQLAGRYQQRGTVPVYRVAIRREVTDGGAPATPLAGTRAVCGLDLAGPDRTQIDGDPAAPPIHPRPLRVRVTWPTRHPRANRAGLADATRYQGAPVPLPGDGGRPLPSEVAYWEWCAEMDAEDARLAAERLEAEQRARAEDAAWEAP